MAWIELDTTPEQKARTRALYEKGFRVRDSLRGVVAKKKSPPRKASTGNANADSLGANVLDGIALTGFNGSVWDRLRASTPGDGRFQTQGTLFVESFNTGFNGATWDRMRTVHEVTLLASGARTTTQTSADLANFNADALTVVLDMTAVGTGSVTVTIEMKDSTSGKYIVLLTGAAITTNSVNRYRVGPDIAAVVNSIAQDYLPRVFRIVVTANNANSATYSVGYHLSNI